MHALAESEERCPRRGSAPRPRARRGSAPSSASPREAAVGAVQRERERRSDCSGSCASPSSEEAALDARAGAARSRAGRVRRPRAPSASARQRDLAAARRAPRRAPDSRSAGPRRGPASDAAESRASLQEELARLARAARAIETAPRLEEEIDRRVEKKRARARGRVRQARGGADRVGARPPGGRDQAAGAARRSRRGARSSAIGSSRPARSGICPTCARPLGDSYRAVLELLDEQLETLARRWELLRVAVEQLGRCRTTCKALDERRRQLHARVERALAPARQGAAGGAGAGAARRATSPPRSSASRRWPRELRAIPAGYDAARHDLVRAEVDAARAARRARPRDSARRSRASRSWRASATQSPSAAALHDARCASCARGATRASASEARVRGAARRARADDDRAAGRRAGRGRRRRRSTAAPQALADARRAARRRAGRARAQLAELRSERRLHDELDRAYPDIRTDLNFQLRPELSELASAFLAELTDARYSELELDDQYNLTVLEDGMPKPVISGGEEDLANLVLRLAISQMIAERAGPAVLAADSRRGLRLARRVAASKRDRAAAPPQDRFEQVIVITHIESVREGLDHVVTVATTRRPARRWSSRPMRAAVTTARRSADGATTRHDRRSGGLMATARTWRRGTHPDGPYRARVSTTSGAQPGVQRRVHRTLSPRWPGRRPRAVPQSGDLALRDRGRRRRRDALARRAWRDRRVQRRARSRQRGMDGPARRAPGSQGGGLGKAIVTAGSSGCARTARRRSGSRRCRGRSTTSASTRR